MKNMTEFGKFKSLKKGSSLVTEDVTLMDDTFRVRTSVSVPSSLVNAFMKKVKDETGEKVEDRFGKTEIAELLVDYMNNTFLSIENLPTTIVMGSDYGSVQPVQTQTQVQDVIQEEPQVQTQIQDTQTQVQNPQAQGTAQEIQAQEIQTQTGQAQTVQTQATQGQPPIQEI